MFISVRFLALPVHLFGLRCQVCLFQQSKVVRHEPLPTDARVAPGHCGLPPCNRPRLHRSYQVIPPTHPSLVLNRRISSRWAASIWALLKWLSVNRDTTCGAVPLRLQGRRCVFPGEGGGNETLTCWPPFHRGCVCDVVCVKVTESKQRDALVHKARTSFYF